MSAPGMLHHLPALCAVTAPSAASYFRLRPNRWAPTTADLGVQDRGSAVRICPVYATAAASVARQFNVEFRVADATASPYLALGALVHAGLDGLRHRRRLADLTPAALPGLTRRGAGPAVRGQRGGRGLVRPGVPRRVPPVQARPS